ncbi:hypothetical protein [Paenibacillus jiagnxiensis]|uniref:hypothetical protein n=1 Tax=Paenibacillus jiagnxiensis TaxID=3228926 RepID=UPI0033B490CF
MTVLLILEDIINVPNRGVVLMGAADDEFHQKGSLYKNLIGSKISIEKKDGTNMTLEVKDISISFSIANIALIGINVKEDIHAEEIKKGSKVLLLE